MKTLKIKSKKQFIIAESIIIAICLAVYFAVFFLWGNKALLADRELYEVAFVMAVSSAIIFAIVSPLLSPFISPFLRSIIDSSVLVIISTILIAAMVIFVFSPLFNLAARIAMFVLIVFVMARVSFLIVCVFAPRCHSQDAHVSKKFFVTSMIIKLIVIATIMSTVFLFNH